MQTESDVAIIGAGLAGLACARQLQRLGYGVLVLEKSRGVGGRLATRRLHGTLADHGTCYLSPREPEFQALVEQLIQQGVVRVWTDTIHTATTDGKLQATTEQAPRYAAPEGMTAIAKFLATELDIRFSHRVQALTLVNPRRWRLTIEQAQPDNAPSMISVDVGAVVVAIPAPQALALLLPLATDLAPEFLRQLESVQFTPCLSAIAGYPNSCAPEWLTDVRAISLPEHPDLAWIGLDSSKRHAPEQLVFVLQSTATFAERYLDVTNLDAAGQQLLHHAAIVQPWLAKPDWVQVHRWRYAFAQTPLSVSYLPAITDAPLVCTGDWCGGTRAGQAFQSGLAVAEYLNQQLEGRSLPSNPIGQDEIITTGGF